MRLSSSAHCLLKGFPDLILIGRQPNDRFQVTEPGVQERLVVGDPMLNTRGWSCFSQLITGGVSRRQGNGVTRHLGVRIRTSVLEKDILPDNVIR